MGLFIFLILHILIQLIATDLSFGLNKLKFKTPTCCLDLYTENYYDLIGRMFVNRYTIQAFTDLYYVVFSVTSHRLLQCCFLLVANKGRIGKLKFGTLSPLFLRISVKILKIVGPTCFMSLSPISSLCQTGEMLHFSSISLASTSLSPNSSLPNKP